MIAPWLPEEHDGEQQRQGSTLILLSSWPIFIFSPWRPYYRASSDSVRDFNCRPHSHIPSFFIHLMIYGVRYASGYNENSSFISGNIYIRARKKRISVYGSDLQLYNFYCPVTLYIILVCGFGRGVAFFFFFFFFFRFLFTSRNKNVVHNANKGTN